jgi:APA family basic amino acid/polyamine antiporter
MTEGPQSMKKVLGSMGVFCIAAGAMISSGLFVLPSILYLKAGPSIILSYVFAGFFMLPAVLSKTELATAMPKSGGTYYFVHRSLGPLFGTFAGLANWFSISLKSAFALIGIGIFIEPLLPGFTPDMMKYVAVGFTLFFTVLNITSVRESSRLQIILVSGLIALLLFYIFSGMGRINVHRYVPFVSHGWRALFGATGMVFISYGGLTKVTSIAGEVREPGKTIPTGMLAAFIIVTFLYALTVFVTVGLLDTDTFRSSLTPIAYGASTVTGTVGSVLLSLAGLAAFITTANAGLLSASRIPLAMAEDNLVPAFLAKLNFRLKSPVYSILITSFFMIFVILFLDLESLVKVASTMMLILFVLVNLSVILMRESSIVSYRPEYTSPLYPYVQIAGIVIYTALIIEMGTIPLMITGSFFVASLLWFFLYSKSRSQRESALIRIVERVTSREMRSSMLSDELRDLLVERDGIVEDRFDRIIKNAEIVDLQGEAEFKELFHVLAEMFSRRLNLEPEAVFDLLIKREEESTTVIHEGLAIPHIICPGRGRFDIAVIRARGGVHFGPEIPPVYMIFALIGSSDERNFHLQALMAIAQIVQNRDFAQKWKAAPTTQELRNLILLSQRARKGTV